MVFKHAFFVLIFCLIHTEISAQIFNNPPKVIKQLSVGQKKDNFMQYAAASADGGIVAVGYTEGGGFSNDDILITKIGADGRIVFEKTIGTTGKDRCAAFDEDMFGGLYVAGSSEYKTEFKEVVNGQVVTNKNLEKTMTRLWVKKLTDKGVVVMDKGFAAINSTAQINYIKYDGTSLNLLGIEHDSLKSWMLNTEGEVMEQYFYERPCLRKLNIKKNTVLATPEYTYIYGFGTLYSSEKKGQAFILKIKNDGGVVVAEKSFPDKNVRDIGNIILSEQGQLVIVGTTNKTDLTDENVFVIKMDTSLTTDRNYFDKTYNDFRPNNFDEGNYIYQSSSDVLTVFGASKSHKQVSHTTNFMLFNLSIKDGEMVNKKPFFWGDEQNDAIQTVIKPNDGSLWICGTKDNGNSLMADKDFYFACIHASKTPVLLQPVLEKVEEEPTLVQSISTQADTLFAGTKMDIDFRVEVKVENKNFKGYKIKAFSRKANDKVQLPEIIDLSNKKWKNLDLKLPISVDADLEKEADMPVSLCLFNPQGQCLDTLERMIHLKPTPKARYVVLATSFKGERNDSIFKSEKGVFSITFQNIGTAKGKDFSLNMLPVSNVIFIERNDYKEAEWHVGEQRTFNYQFLPQDLITENSLELKLSYKDASTPSVFAAFKTPLAKRKVVERVVFTPDKPQMTPIEPQKVVIAPDVVIVEKPRETVVKLPVAVAEKPKESTVKPPVVAVVTPPKPKDNPPTVVVEKVKKIDEIVPSKPIVVGEKMKERVPINPSKPIEKPVEKPIEAPKVTPVTTTNGIAVAVLWSQNFENKKLTVDAEDYIVAVVAIGVHALTDKNFVIVHNGIEKRIDGVKMDEISLDSKPTTPQSYSTYLDFKLKLKPGINTVSVKVKDGESGNTTPEIKVNYRPFDKGTLYVLSVGVPDKSGRLHYTQKDAKDFAKIFSDKADRREVQVVTLTSPDSTTATSIATQINELSKQANRPNDAVILYFSTHGVIGENSELRLLGSTYTVDNKKFTSIDFNEDIIKPLQKLPCSKYLFIDACKSGSAKNQQDVTDLLKSSVQNSSFFTLTSCSGSESSYEDDKWQNGAFTKILKDIVTNSYTCKMLDGKNGLAPDGFLSIVELFPTLQKAVQDLVKKDRKEQQTPVLITPQKAETKPIFDYKKD